MVLSASYAVLLCCFWPLRLLYYCACFIVLFSAWLSLGSSCVCSTQVIGDKYTATTISHWWFALTIPAYVMVVSLVGQGVTRVAGFRSFQNPSASMEPT